VPSSRLESQGACRFQKETLTGSKGAASFTGGVEMRAEINYTGLEVASHFESGDWAAPDIAFREAHMRSTSSA